jgi:KUP system potassium uptake protein
LAPLAALFLTVEIAFFGSNIAKLEHGAYLSLAIGLVVSVVMLNWRRCQAVVSRNRVEQEGALDEFLAGLAAREPGLARVPGVAVFLCRDQATTPLALRAAVEHTHTLHERVVIVSVNTVSIPHIDTFDRFSVELLGHGLFKVFHVGIRLGYWDPPNVPEALALCRMRGLLERNLDLEQASYFASRIAITPTDVPVMQRWRKRLFITMARNASSPIEHFRLPGDRTVIMGSQVAL